MRYVKCDNDNCQADISGKPHFLLLKVTESKGKHRNPKRQTIVRLCEKCIRKLQVNEDVTMGCMGKIEQTIKESRLKREKQSFKKLTTTTQWYMDDGCLREYIDTKIYKTKERLLVEKLQKLGEVLTSYKPFHVQHYEGQTLREATDLHRIQTKIGEYIKYLGSHISTYTKSENISVYREMELEDRYYENRQEVVHDVGKLKKNYFDKIAFDNNPEYKNLVVQILTKLHLLIGDNMVKHGIFIKEDNVIDIETNKKDNLVLK